MEKKKSRQNNRRYQQGSLKRNSDFFTEYQPFSGISYKSNYYYRTVTESSVHKSTYGFAYSCKNTASRQQHQENERAEKQQRHSQSFFGEYICSLIVDILFFSVLSLPAHFNSSSKIHSIKDTNLL